MPDNFELPDELKGKTPEEMYALMKADHERVLAEATQNAQPQQTQQPAVQQQTQTPVYPTFAPPPPAIPEQTSEPDLFSQPEQYMEKQFQQRIAPLAETVAANMMETNKEVFRGRIGEDEWKRYGSDIEQFVKTLHPSVRMNMGAYDAAYRYIRGTKVDDIVAEASKKAADDAVAQALSAYGIQPQQPVQTQQPRTSLFQPKVGVTTPSTPPMHFTIPGVKKSQLTDEQRVVAEKFGMTEDEYLEMAEYNTDWISKTRKGLNG
jgi:hypothetical protein